MLDPQLDSCKTLICLYHERWEEELTFDEIKTHQRERPVLRSQIPAGVIQEIYGLLLGHYVIRVLIQEAAESLQIDPERISFTATLKILRCRLPQIPKNQNPHELECWYRNLVREVSEEVLPPRRNRINPRVIKVKMSKWPKKKSCASRPCSTVQDFRAGDHCAPLSGIGLNRPVQSPHQIRLRDQADQAVLGINDRWVL